MTDADTLTIARRFCGPPASANGGYVCGLLGRRMAGAATVRLLSPPPLDEPLTVTASDEGLHLLHDAQLLAQARPATLTLDAPPAPTLEQAQQAATRYVGFATHPFPGCFVCGPEREPGDGLRIFPGALAAQGMVAAPWTPAANLADEEGRLLPEFAWSALDCTGFFAFAPLPDGAPALLGELTARIDAIIEPGAPHIVVGWSLGSEGRKRFAGSALYSATGNLLAIARATWIVMPPGAVGATGGV